MIPLGVFVLFALLPGAFIISRRDWLTDVLFAGDWDSHLSIEPKALLAVGLVLIGISTLIPGLEEESCSQDVPKWVRNLSGRKVVDGTQALSSHSLNEALSP
jgi:hypothetical protein